VEASAISLSMAALLKKNFFMFPLRRASIWLLSLKLCRAISHLPAHEGIKLLQVHSCRVVGPIGRK
jgi:hypothetical protein